MSGEKLEAMRSVKKLTTLDSFLTADGTREVFRKTAIKEVREWQAVTGMRMKSVSSRTVMKAPKPARKKK